MIQWAGLGPELCSELELLAIKELARTVPLAVEEEGEEEEEDEEEGPF